MRWDLFSGPKNEKANDLRNAIQNEIRALERFAPRQYRKERHIHYYNCLLLEGYLEPLQSLLRTISGCKALAASGNMTQLLQDLFFKVKDFYDPRKKLTADQAVQDREMRRRLRQLLVIFYNEQKTTEREILSHLKKRKRVEEETNPKQMLSP